MSSLSSPRRPGLLACPVPGTVVPWLWGLITWQLGLGLNTQRLCTSGQAQSAVSAARRQALAFGFPDMPCLGTVSLTAAVATQQGAILAHGVPPRLTTTSRVHSCNFRLGQKANMHPSPELLQRAQQEPVQCAVS